MLALEWHEGDLLGLQTCIRCAQWILLRPSNIHAIRRRLLVVLTLLSVENNYTNGLDERYILMQRGKDFALISHF